MPKIAANEVERALIMADAESGAERVTRAETDKRRNEFLEAFQNAARLRSIGYKVVMLRGRKSHAVQLVVKTTIKRDAERGAGKYVLCLLPSPNARRPFKYQTPIWSEGDYTTRKLLGMQDHFLRRPTTMHSQWINEERLREAA